MKKKDYNIIGLFLNILYCFFYFKKSAWKQGIMSLIEAISIEQPANGWFVPNCQDETLFFSAQAIEVRKDLTLPLFVSGEQLNLLQV